jgi:ParB family chromosome partitioning protein
MPANGLDDTARNFRRRGLGRGLDALFAGAPRDEHGDVLLIAVDPRQVAPNPEQPRRDFDEASLDTMAESIRLHGLLHPIVVQREGDGYRLVAGERRLRAAQRAAMTSIPAIVRPAADSARQALELALTENMLRADLNPIEEASAYARLADAFGMTHDAIALRLGKSRPVVTNAIRLLGLAAPVQKLVAAARLSPSNARALLSLPEAEQIEVAGDVEKLGMSVHEVERLVQRRMDARAAARRAAAGIAVVAPSRPDDDALQTAFEQTLGLAVRLERRRRGGGGRLIIDFFDDRDLDALYRRLGGPPL